jgi:hypothetical protein
LNGYNVAALNSTSISDYRMTDNYPFDVAIDDDLSEGKGAGKYNI